MYCKLLEVISAFHIQHSINSSKVYCKSVLQKQKRSGTGSINSSKVYCKYIKNYQNVLESFGINSSKVYCK